MKSKLVLSSFLFVLITFSSVTHAVDKTLNIGGAKIEVVFDPGVAKEAYSINREQVIAWIERSANAVSKYFTRFPVKTLTMSITDGARRQVNGSAYHGAEPFVRIRIRPTLNKQAIDEDWVMVHEMVHLAFPPVNRRHKWLLEGLATYVEPIVRVRAGMLTEDKAWEWLIKGTPNGLPEAGNKGLDNTPTWGQKYWGGAIFFLVADLRIHKQSKNKFGIEHALRAIQNNGGSMQLTRNWDVEKTLKIGDQATNTNVLVNLYNEMKDKPVMTDLEAIWNELGVSLVDGKIVYNDQAKSAHLRESIMYEQTH